MERGEKQQSKLKPEHGLILQKPNAQATRPEKQKRNRPSNKGTIQDKTNNYPKPPSITIMKRVILITGTPCIGKTTLSKQLTIKLDALYINLTDYAKTYGLTLGEDKERNTTIIDEEKMQVKLTETINATEKANVIVDGHYASAVIPDNLVTYVFVLRRNPIELKTFMTKCNFPPAKLWENLSAEILDVCLVEALQTHKGKVCELDITGKTVETVTGEVLDVLEKGKKCYSGYVDWLGMLEREGLTDEYLRD